MKPDRTNQFYYKTNRLQQLRGFCYAAQFNNISKAAKHLGLTHSSISLQIKTLEQDLGVKLFERNGPHLKITAEGKKLLKIALHHVEGIDKIQEEFKKELSEQKRTEFHICTNSTGINFILPNVLDQYLKTYPDTYVTIHYADFKAATDQLKDDKVEIVLLPKREHIPFPDEFEYIPIFYHIPALITKRDHPLAGRKNLTVEEISRYEITMSPLEMRVIPNIYDIFPKHNVNKKLRINFVNWETTRKYIEKGMVISISSDVIISDDNDQLMATSLMHLFKAPVSYGFVVKKGKKLPEKLQNLIDISRSVHAKRDIKKVYGN